MTLTAKQEAFAQAIADGLNQSDAYRAAYSAGKMKSETVQQVASRLMNDRKVSARVCELREALANKSLWSREQSIGILVDGLAGAKFGDQISAVKVLNEMQGFNEPTKHELSVLFPKVINVIAGRA